MPRRIIPLLTALSILVQPLAAQANAFQANVTAQGGDVAVVGSKVTASTGDANLTASNNVALGVAYDEKSSTSSSSSKSMLASSSKTSESQKSTAVGSEVTAGRDVNATAQTGDVSVTASTVVAGNAANLTSQEGQVQFLAAKDSESSSSTSTSSNPVWWKNQGKGSVDETVKVASLTTGEGGLNVTAKTGVVVEGKAGLKESIASDPKLAWMAPLANRNDVVFKAVNEAHEKWDYKQQGLSAPAAAVIALAVTIATDGMGSGLLGGLGGVGGAMADAGFSALVSQAAIGMINHQGDLGAVMKDLGSIETLKNLAATIATAGLTQGLLNELNLTNANITDAVSKGASKTLLKTQQLALKAAVNTAGDTLIRGEGLTASLKSNLISSATALIGENVANEIGQAAREGKISTVTQMVAHAALGCGTAAANGASCAAGAVGGVTGEVVGQLYFSAANANELSDELAELVSTGQITPDQARERVASWKQKGYDITRVASALTAAAFAKDGADVQAGANAGTNAVNNNVCGDLCPLVVMAVVASLEAVDKLMLAKDAYMFSKAVRDGDDEKAAELGTQLAIEGGVEALGGNFVPGSVLGVKIVNNLRKQGMDNIANALEAVGRNAGEIKTDKTIIVDTKGNALVGDWSATKKLTAPENAQKHWADHSKEFPEFANAGQYVEGAQKFVSSPPAGTLVKTRPDGDVLLYQESTNTFAVKTAEGAPRTMFKPTDGVAYWNKQ